MGGQTWGGGGGLVIDQAAERQAQPWAGVTIDQELVVGGDDDGGAEAVHLGKQLHEALGLVVVEIAGRLIGQQQGGAVDDGAGDGDTLLLAAGKLGGPGVALFGQTDPPHDFGNVGAYLALGAAGDAQREGDVVVGGEVGEEAEILEHHPDAAAQSRQGGTRGATGGDGNGGAQDREATAGGADGEVQEAEQAGLAGAGGAQQPAKTAGGNGEGKVAQNIARAAVVQPYTLKLNDHEVKLAQAAAARNMGEARSAPDLAARPCYTGVMRIACPVCEAAYDVPDEKLSGRSAVRCVRCGESWSPVAPPVPMAVEAVRVEPMLPPTPEPLPRRSFALPLAWAGSVGLVGSGVAILLIEHQAVAALWPAMGRVYALLGMH